MGTRYVEESLTQIKDLQQLANEKHPGVVDALTFNKCSCISFRVVSLIESRSSQDANVALTEFWCYLYTRQPPRALGNLRVDLLMAQGSACAFAFCHGRVVQGSS